MNVDFTPEQEARLAQVASKAGTAPEKLAAHVIVRYLDEETRFLSAVEKGLAAAAGGEFFEEEEIDGHLEEMFKA
jgi:predicted transcriptional regulator